MAFKAIPVVSGKVAATLADYPAYVKPSAMTGWGAITLAEAQSSRWYSDEAKTTELAREVVSADEIHVKVTSLTTSTTIYVDYDGVRADYAVTDTYGAEAVWSDYVSVWHSGESSGDLIDSTGNNNLTDNNTVGTGVGKLGNGRDYERTNSEFFRITDAAQTGLDMTGDYTLQTWYNLETTGITQVFASKSNFPTIGMQWYIDSANKLTIFASDDNATSGRSAWVTTNTVPLTGLHMHHLTFDVIDGSTEPVVSFYVDGASVASGAGFASNMLGAMSDNTNRFAMGSEPETTSNALDGILDEIRFRVSLLSSNWITTEYNNQDDVGAFWGTVTDASSFNPAIARRRLLL